MVAFNAVSSNAVDSTTVSVNHTAAGSNRYVRIVTFQNTDHSITSISYGAQTPTLLGISSNGRLRVFELVAPATGVQAVQAVSNVSGGFVIIVTSYTDVDQVTPSRTPVAGSSATGSTQVAATGLSELTDLMYSAAVMINSSMAVADGATERANVGGVGFWQAGVSDIAAGTPNTQMRWTSANSFGNNSIIVSAIRALAGPPGPSISTVGTAGSVGAQEDNWTITGTNFDAATVSITQGTTTVAQTVHAGQTSTLITCDTIFDGGAGPHLKYGTGTLTVTNADTQFATAAVTITVPAGFAFVNLGTPNPDPSVRITAVPDLAAGDQLEISNVIGGTIADVTVNTDATFDCAESVVSFDVRCWSVADSTWGAIGTQFPGSSGPTPGGGGVVGIGVVGAGVVGPFGVSP